MEIITGIDHDIFKGIPGRTDGVQYEKFLDGSYQLYAPADSHFENVESHTYYGGYSYKEMRSIAKTLTVTKCENLNSEGYCTGD